MAQMPKAGPLSQRSKVFLCHASPGVLDWPRMRTPSLFYFAILFVFGTAVQSYGQAVCKTISEAEQRTYGFQPSKLSFTERTQQSSAMDAYWELVKGSGAQGIACLRSLLQKQNDGFAVFDEASLLYSLDHSPESVHVIAGAIAKADLSEVKPEEYVRMGLLLARQGVDIEAIAHNYINAKNDVTAYLVPHGGYKLDRTAGAILLYGVMPTNKIDEALSREIHSSNPETRNAAAIVWSLNLTPASFKALSALGAMQGFSEAARKQVFSTLKPFAVPVEHPKYTREQMLAKLAKFPELEMDASVSSEQENKALDNSVYATFNADDVTVLRESRRKLITGVSNESVEGYVDMSRVLLNLINKLNLYPEDRRRN
jgi:hypothetical protein